MLNKTNKDKRQKVNLEYSKDDPENTKKNTRKTRRPILSNFSLSDGLFIAFASFFSYALLYFYRTGYLFYFKIPSYFVTFNTSDVIFVGIGIIFIILNFLLDFPVLKALLSEGLLRKITKRRVVLSNYIFLGPFTIFMSLFILWEFKLLILVVSVIFIIIALLIQLTLRDISPEQVFLENYGDFLSKEQFENFANFVLYSILLLILSSALGKLDALSKRSYSVANTNPECVVLYVTSDRVICSPFDRLSKEVSPKFKVLYLQDNQDLEFQRERIGPLHLKPTPTPTPQPTLTPTVTPTLLPTRTHTQLPSPSPVDID